MLFTLLLIGVTFYFLFKNNEMKQMLPVLKEASAVYLIFGLLLMLLFNVSEALAIRVLMKSFSYDLSFGKCLKYAFIGFYYCSITPGASGGQPVQVYYMKRDGIEIGASSLSILIITASYQAGILLIGLVMFFLRPALISESIGTIGYLVVLGAGFNLTLVVFFACVAFQKSFLEQIISGCIRLLVRLKIIKNADASLRKAKIHLAKYQEGAGHLKKNPRILLYTLAILSLQILCRLSVAYAVFQAFGLRGYDYIDILALQTMLALAMEFLPLPGAVGATETGFLAINKLIFGAGTLVPAMLLSRGISYYAFLLISGVVSLAAQIADNGRHARKNGDLR